jgi:hypothetical protein
MPEAGRWRRRCSGPRTFWVVWSRWPWRAWLPAGSAVDAPKVVQCLQSVSCQSNPLHGGNDAFEAINVDVPLLRAPFMVVVLAISETGTIKYRVRVRLAACLLDVEHMQAVGSGGRPRRDGQVLPVDVRRVEAAALAAALAAAPSSSGHPLLAVVNRAKGPNHPPWVPRGVATRRGLGITCRGPVTERAGPAFATPSSSSSDHMRRAQPRSNAFALHRRTSERGLFAPHYVGRDDAPWADDGANTSRGFEQSMLIVEQHLL